LATVVAVVEEVALCLKWEPVVQVWAKVAVFSSAAVVEANQKRPERDATKQGPPRNDDTLGLFAWEKDAIIVVK
jgi:hypothetical protein